MSLGTRSAIALALFAGFYLFGLAIAASLLAFAWWLGNPLDHSGTTRLQFGAVVAAGAALWAMRPRADHFEPPGPQVTEREQPALFDEISRIAAAARQPMPRDVYLSDELGAGVTDRGGISGLGGHRVMILGMPLLHILSVAELRAVLAHEFGHYAAGDTGLGRVVYRTRAAIGRALQETEGQVLEVLFSAYGRLFLKVSMGVSRAQEFAADAFAATLAGAGPLASSLQKLERASVPFIIYSNLRYQSLLEQGFRLPFLEGLSRELDQMATTADAEDAVTPPAELDPFDSHPPTEQRVAALQAHPSWNEAGRAADLRPASSLLAGREDLERIVLRARPADAVTVTEIQWAEVPTKVWLPSWRSTVVEDADALSAISVEALPMSAAEAVAAGRLCRAPHTKLMDGEELTARLRNSISLAIAVKLSDSGWTIEDRAGRAAFIKSNIVVDPFAAELDAVSTDPSARTAWERFRQTTGLRGPLHQPA